MMTAANAKWGVTRRKQQQTQNAKRKAGPRTGGRGRIGRVGAHQTKLGLQSLLAFWVVFGLFLLSKDPIVTYRGGLALAFLVYGG